MQVVGCPEPADAATAAAIYIARYIKTTLSMKARCVLALSGGSTGVLLLRALIQTAIDWEKVDVVQVDERVTDVSEPSRNFYFQRRILVDEGGMPAERLAPMPVEATDLATACNEYHALLEHLAGTPPLLDLVHLGLGDDGHTASLVPGDPVLQEQTRTVAMTAEYSGFRRMTLTYPILNRAHRRLWLVTGTSKATMVARLLRGEMAEPAGRIRRSGSALFADSAALSSRN